MRPGRTPPGDEQEQNEGRVDVCAGPRVPTPGIRMRATPKK